MDAAICSNTGFNSKDFDLGNARSKKWRVTPRSNLARSLASFAAPAWTLQQRKNIVITTAVAEAFDKLARRITTLCDGSLGTQAPSQLVRQTAIDALEWLEEHDVLPSLVNATGDESLLFEFFIGEETYSVDMYNSGEIVYLRRLADRPSFSEISRDQLNNALNEIVLAYARINMR